MNTQNSNVLPNIGYWICIVILTVFAAFSHLSLPGGWVLYVFPLELYLLGRGKQQRSEGFRRS